MTRRVVQRISCTRNVRGMPVGLRASVQLGLMLQLGAEVDFRYPFFFDRIYAYLITRRYSQMQTQTSMKYENA